MINDPNEKEGYAKMAVFFIALFWLLFILYKLITKP